MSKIISHQKRILRRIRPWVLIFSLIAITLWLTHRKWLPSLCLWLNVSAKPHEADFIVYLGGEEIPRAELAAQLYSDRFAPRIIASGSVPSLYSGLEILRKRNISIDDIIINKQATNTWTEAQQIFAILRQERATSALIVTSVSHTRRASATYESFQNESRIDLSFVSAKATYDCENWWNTTGGRYAMQYEYPRLIFYFFRYGVSPF